MLFKGWTCARIFSGEPSLTITIVKACGGLDEGSVQFSSVAQSCLTLCDPMNHSMPGLPVHHQLHEFTQTHEG